MTPAVPAGTGHWGLESEGSQRRHADRGSTYNTYSGLNCSWGYRGSKEDRPRTRENIGQHHPSALCSLRGEPGSTVLHWTAMPDPYEILEMSVIVTSIIITHEACSPLLFLIRGEDNAISNFYSKELFSCLCCIYLKRKHHQQNLTNKKPHQKPSMRLERACAISTLQELESKAYARWKAGFRRFCFWFVFPLFVVVVVFFNCE